MKGELPGHVTRERSSDIKISSTFDNMKVEEMAEIVKKSRISGLFCLDSKQMNTMV